MNSSFIKPALLLGFLLCLTPISFIKSYAQNPPPKKSVEDVKKNRDKNIQAEKSAIHEVLSDAIRVAKRVFNESYTQCGTSSTYTTLAFIQGSQVGYKKYDATFNFIEFDDVRGFDKKISDIDDPNNGKLYIKFTITADSYRRLSYSGKTLQEGEYTRYTHDYEGKRDWDKPTYRPKVLLVLVLSIRTPYQDFAWQEAVINFNTDFRDTPTEPSYKWELRAPTCQELEEKLPSEAKERLQNKNKR